MAQVKFYGMLLDFEFVREYYNNSEFSRFIFQPYMQDSTKVAEDYYLMVYAMDNKDTVMQKVDLAVVGEDIYNAPQRLDMGNVALTRLQLEPFMQQDRVSSYASLFLSPRAFGAYVAYNVTGIPKGVDIAAKKPKPDKETDVEVEIKPSPPAPPAP